MNKRAQGFALITAAIVLLVAASVALLLSNEVSMGQRLLASDSERAELRYLIEAGFAHADWQLGQNDTCVNFAALPATNFGTHSYNASYSPDYGSPVSVTLTAKHGGGVTQVVSRDMVEAYQTPAQNLLQPSAADGVDAYIWQNNPNTKYGTDDETWVSCCGSNTSRSLLQFDISGLVSGAKIVSATLSMHHRSGNDPNVPVTAHRITNPWNEAFVSWNDRDNGTPWDTAGGDYDSAVIATTNVGPVSSVRYEWDVSDLVKAWYSGATPNYGVVLATTESGSNGERFDTSDHFDPSRRPSLTIELACECGVDCASASSGNLLMVVVDATILSAQELLKKGFIEAWGYTVNLINQSDDQATYDAAIDGNDVVYVPSSISSSILGTKLFAATIGVVNENGEQVDELGFAQDKLYKSLDEIDVLDNTHYITALFPSGLLTITTSVQAAHMLSGSLAPGLQTLAQSLNIGTIWKSSLAVLDVGDNLYGGGTAEGRRVQLPWGGGAFDIDQLTDDGRSLMRRAIEWGAAESGALVSPLAHWKLDETSGSVAVDSIGGHDGTLQNGPSWATGQIDGALNMDGGNDYVEVPDDNTLSLTSFSLSAWIRPTALSGWRLIVSKGTTATAVNYYLSTIGDEVSVGFYDGGWVEFNTTTVNLTTNQWYHIVGTYDDVSKEGKVYVDGVLMFSGTTTKSPVANTNSLWIGREAAGNFWPGKLDDVRIYDASLSAVQVAELAADTGGGGSSPPGGVSFESFAEASRISDGLMLNVAAPTGIIAGDLLIAAVTTDGHQVLEMTAPAGWSLIDHGDQSGQVTLDVWWKIAGAAEPADYNFSWAESQKAYGWIMRFTGHDPTTPIDVSATTGGSSNAPLSPSVVTTVADALILRIGGFDDDDIDVGNPGLTGHTPITMGKSSNGTGTVSGGAGYLSQAAAGDSGTSTFWLNATEEYRAVTIAIAPP